mmetsp:Transcript_1845/g.1284  ORF Transcript_1845/g.1284 Transcript_1845/m.1284 type:complete len:392 (+) Transcript_1845:807-1982(+)|eukprot:CAMPEP_0201281948 /NCGR_PEP_ID=MMETSP1317-20130820/4490_1 /ASSEMBLY_ACC=CAM_ASM_000770 /TAXON_ID=187299 /ORGANISM="Undescribed Undescribed, Strain Undescribed" /LENGTH=391 /DNA_ID=CAMNT_0047593327 /DNA_START=1288 /DNA_END=2463 /DNA_ORIENTATION=+
MKFIKDIEVTGKRVFVRVDFNVPLDKNLKITDDSRIKGALPTLSYLISKNASLIIASHLGRPKGKPLPQFSLAPVAKHMSYLLGKEVHMAKDCVGSEVKYLVKGMKAGEITLLENLRFHKEEQENNEAFAKELADLCDVYINDAFAVSHRNNASVVAITKFASVSAAGFLLYKELDYFKKSMKNPKRPLIAIVGGAKVSSKLAALKNMLSHVDKIIIGGAMANTFLKARGLDLAESKLEIELIEEAKSVMNSAAEKGIEFFLPEDVIIAKEISPKAETQIVSVNDIPSGYMALDIGAKSSELFCKALNDAETIIWNGPMGAFEVEAFSRGTMELTEGVANSSALTIAGGGDTDAAIHKAGVLDKISYISTGGGAFLTLLEGKSLTAVKALE